MTQRVLVTAGASGIGLAIAKAFSESGAKVHISDIDADALERTAGSNPSFGITQGDVSSVKDVEQLFDDVQANLGGLDVLINNAGIAGATASVEEAPLEAWSAVLNVNLTGTFLVTQKAIPLLKKSPQASIIVMSSLAGRFGYPNRVAYSTTKWGLVGFTKTLAMELGPHNITANSIHPGAVEGPRLTNILEGRARLSGRNVQEESESALANQSVKKFINPDDVAALILFLCGPHARTISGQVFPIDGDSKSTV